MIRFLKQSALGQTDYALRNTGFGSTRSASVTFGIPAQRDVTES
jgi:hypothetical protein